MKKPSADTDPLERYYTPPELARQVLRRLVYRGPMTDPRPGRILEASAGTGVWVRELRAFTGAEITAVEIEASRRKNLIEAGATVVWQGDFERFSSAKGFDLIVGNPPYSKVEPHLLRAWNLLNPGGRLVWLLPLIFIATDRRARLLKEIRPEQVSVVVGRPSFTGPSLPGKGTARAEYCVVTWHKGVALDEPRLDWLWWKP